MVFKFFSEVHRYDGNISNVDFSVTVYVRKLGYQRSVHVFSYYFDVMSALAVAEVYFVVFGGHAIV